MNNQADWITYFIRRGFNVIPSNAKRNQGEFYAVNGDCVVSFNMWGTVNFIELNGLYLNTIDEIKRFIQEKAKA